ncbi:threonine/serine exporter family protein, partial [Acinetobacter baumannii]|nr:threonine/serine exporter family protein [Acinetobacter baumannii]
MFNVPPRLLWVVGLGGVISVGVRTLAMDYFNVGLPIGTLLGAMTVSIISLKAVHWFHVPSHVLTIPSV